MLKLLSLLLLSYSLVSCTTAAPKPIKALLLTGGCCHDYHKQTKALKQFTEEKINIVWDVLHEGGKGGDHRHSIYAKKDWAKSYDVVVHNECFAATKDDTFIKKVVRDHLDAEKGVIMVHCAMHTFRDAKEGTEAWCKLIGLQSKKHEHQAEYDVENIAPKHPIMKGFPQIWKAPKDELYIVVKEYPGMTPLARAYGPKSKKFSTCIWTNEIENSKVFGITFGHNTHTMETKEFQSVFTKGLLWSTGHLTADGETEAGYEAVKKTK